MAARTNMGVGLGITVGLLGTATLALFVLTFVFLAGKQNAEKERDSLREQFKEIVTDNERNGDDLRKLIAEAKPKSLAAYLVEQTKAVGQKTTGSERDTPKTLAASIQQALEGSSSSNLLALIAAKDGEIAQLKKEKDLAEAARTRALTDQQNEVELTRKQKADFDAAVAAMSGDITKYKDGVDALRAQLNKAMAEMTGTVAKIKADAEDREAELNTRLTRAGDELLQAQSKISELKRKLEGQLFKPGDEASLVDGEIIGIDPVDNNVFINRGRNSRIVLGLTFEVYTNASAIRPDPSTGEYPRGKASVEVIRIDQASAVCRVVRNPRGNPVVKGDVIANVVYDPNKQYKFMIYGNFDTNRDGVATIDEAADVRAMIEGWGGAVTDSLAGDLDFLVLGARPVTPPQPPATAPAESIREYLRLVRVVKEYDDLQRQATATSLPILNQNRLFTLVGRN